MKCIFLAAGYATRLYPLTENFPKPLLDVAGKTILDHLIDDLEKTESIDEYIVVSNHKFIDIFKDWASKHTQKITVLDDGSISNETRIGAVKDIKFAIDTLNLKDDALVLAGDNLLDFSLKEFIDYINEKKTSCVMKFVQSDINKLRKTGVLEVDENDKVINMEEKPENPKSNLSCPPFYFYLNKDLALIDKALEDGCGYDAPGSLVCALCKMTTIHALTMPGHRYDIGSIESYNEVKKVFEK